MGLTVFALKGGLLRTSPRLEYFWGALGVNPKAALASLLTQKKPEDVSLRVDLLPLNEDVLSQIEALKSADKAVALSTRDYPELATALAAQLGIALSEAKGETRPQSWNVRALLKAIRPHQWVKNILLLMPLLAAHRFDSGSLLLALLGIVAFSAAASSIYVVNDLVDLEADRLHPKKCKRPFASGTVPLTVGMLTGLVLVSVALGVGAYLGPKFLAITLLYVFVSVAYSMRLKRMRWVDIILLASLYSVRVVAGAAAAGVAVSGAMLFFIFPVFLTLGAVKRLTELTLATNDERLPGRGYGRPDRGKLLNFAVVSMISALLIFLYIHRVRRRWHFILIAGFSGWPFCRWRLGSSGWYGLAIMASRIMIRLSSP